MNQYLTRFVIFAAVLIICPALASAQEYEIVLSRAIKPGTSFRIVASGYQMEKLRVASGNDVLQQKDEQITVELTATVTVLEAREHGKVKKVKVVIEKSEFTIGDRTGPLLPVGTEVIGSVDQEKEVFAVAGSPVSEDVAKALSLLIPLEKSDESDDDVFGTTEKKRVGDSWKLNAEKAAKSLLDVGIRVSKENVDGGAILKGVTKLADGEALEIDAWLDIKALMIPLPDGFTIRDSRLQAKFGGKFPVNKLLDKSEDKKEMTMTFAASGRPDPNGPELRLDMNSLRRTTILVSNRKSAPPPGDK